MEETRRGTQAQMEELQGHWKAAASAIGTLNAKANSRAVGRSFSQVAQQCRSEVGNLERDLRDLLTGLVRTTGLRLDLLSNASRRLIDRSSIFP